MSLTPKKLIAAAVSTAMLGLATGALAQTAAPAPDGQHGPGQRPGMDRMREHRAEHEAERVKAMHDALNIRADQEAAFKAFTVSLQPKRDHANGQGGDRQAPEAMPATTPERLDRMEARIQARDQKVQARITAIKTFYAALSTDQKHTFDALPMLHQAFFERGHGMRGQGMMHGPDMRGPGRPPMGAPPAQD